ncbi:MAG: hypothetical protein R2941_00160 [Desulfobacterales bacterium]
MKNTVMYSGLALPLPMFWFPMAFFWPLRYAEALMDSLWPRDVSMRNSPDRGYHCHDGSGSEYWLW